MRNHDLDLDLGLFLQDEASAPVPADLVGRVTVATAILRPRPRWLATVHGARDRVVLSRGPWFVVTPPARRLALTILVLIALLISILAGAILTRPPEDLEYFNVTQLESASDATYRLAAPVDGSHVLLVGSRGNAEGFPEGVAAIVDSTAGTMATTGFPSVARPMATVTALLDGRVLLAGGWVGDLAPEASATAETYDPTTGEFTLVGPMRSGRYGHVAARLPDGRVLLAGGSGPDPASAEIFDPATNTFSATGPMHDGRIYASGATLTDGRVLVSGGTSPVTAGAIASAELYDPKTGAFTVTGAMGTPRAQHSTSAVPDGGALVVGGRSGEDMSTGIAALGSVERFDPVTGRFLPLDPLVSERAEHGAAVLSDGSVVVIGGDNEDGSTRTAERIDPTGGSTVVGRSDVPHGGADVVAVDGGRLVVAGYGGPPAIWDPLGSPTPVESPTPDGSVQPDDVFQPVSLPHEERIRHAAVAMPDGTVLIVGGQGYGADELTAAMLVDPDSWTAAPVAGFDDLIVGPAVGPLPDGTVLVADPYGVTRRLDPRTGLETVVATSLGLQDPGGISMTIRLYTPSATPIAGGRLLILNRFGTVASDELTARAARVFDPATNEVSIAPPLPCNDAGLPIGLDDGSVLIPCADEGLSAGIYDPTGMTLRLVRDAGAWTDAAPLGSGRVLLMNENAQAGILDVASEAVTAVGPMLGPRVDARSITLDDGRVLVTGGRAAGDMEMIPLDRAELFDPATGTFRDVGPMGAPRWTHTVTRLDDGRVLLYGGADRPADRGDGDVLTAEVFDPALVP